MSENLHAMDDDTLRRYAEWLGIPAETLRGLRDGSLVAVPAEPTEAMLDAGREATTAWGVYRLMLAAAQEPQR